jgi:hypothetical protein
MKSGALIPSALLICTVVAAAPAAAQCGSQEMVTLFGG